MKCEACGVESEDRYCKTCGDVLDEVVRVQYFTNWIRKSSIPITISNI